MRVHCTSYTLIYTHKYDISLTLRKYCFVLFQILYFLFFAVHIVSIYVYIWLHINVYTYLHMLFLLYWNKQVFVALKTFSIFFWNKMLFSSENWCHLNSGWREKAHKASPTLRTLCLMSGLSWLVKSVGKIVVTTARPSLLLLWRSCWVPRWWRPLGSD